MCLEGGGSQKKNLTILGDSKYFSFFPEKNLKNRTPHFFPPQILSFSWVKTPCQISKPYDDPFWEKSNIGGEKKKKNAFNSGHLVPWQRTQVARANFVLVYHQAIVAITMFRC